MPFKTLFRGLSKLHDFTYGHLPSVDVDKHHDGIPANSPPESQTTSYTETCMPLNKNETNNLT